MKTTQCILALALAAAPSGALAQTAVAAARFTLTETYTAPALKEKDENGKTIKGGDLVYENSYYKENSQKYVETYEYGSKMATFKISNKEILEALVGDDVIPTISGWSIVVVDGETFAVTNGSEFIDLDDYLWIEGGDASAATNKEKYVYTSTENSDTEKASGSGKGKELIHIGFQTFDSEVYLSGVASWSDSLKTFGKGEDAYTEWVPGASKVSSISGALYLADEEEVSVIEGSISAAAAKLIDL